MFNLLISVLWAMKLIIDSLAPLHKGWFSASGKRRVASVNYSGDVALWLNTVFSKIPPVKEQLAFYWSNYYKNIL